MKRISSILLLCCLFLALPFGVFGAEFDNEVTGETNGDIEFLSTGILASATGYTYTSPFTFDETTGENLVYAVPTAVNSLGIDVSKWQGNIDWQAVADSGVKFAIVRVGHHYSKGNYIGEDEYFRKNIEGAQAAGIKVGAYIFSQAITEEEAREEAAYIMHRVAKYKLDLPLVFDYEYESGAGRLKDANLSVEKATSICLAFCDYVKANGYDAMVYANAWMFTNKLDADRISANADIWMANYTTNTIYKKDFQYWQYSNKGRVNGIKGNVDCNFGFTDKFYKSGSGCFPFTDVAADSWYYDAAIYAYDNDIIQGMAWNKFAPDASMTRAMLVAMLYRMEGSPDVTGISTSFKDLNADWYKNAVIWGQKNNIVSGVSSTSFEPDTLVTREQIAAFLYRYATYKNIDVSAQKELSDFKDGGTVSSYAVPALKWAVASGYISGFPGGELSPRGVGSRGQVASILYRFLRER